MYQCCSHTSIQQLLESIGAIIKSQKKKAESKAGAYQETTSLPVDCIYDEEAVLREDEVIDDVDDETELDDPGQLLVLFCVCKLCTSCLTAHFVTDPFELRKIVLAVCSSPQCRKWWLQQASNWL